MMSETLRQSLDPSIFWEYRATLALGLLQNLYIFLASAILAMALALVISLSRLSGKMWLRAISTCYVELFRNTPEFVLLIWVYYVLPILLSRLLSTQFSLTPFVASVLGLGFAYSGFLSETMRAGIQSIPRGHIEAGVSLGMRECTILRRIVFPQALRRMLPEALSQLVSLFKATSIVSLVAVPDIMYQVSMVNVDQMQPLPLYTGAALLFCLVIITATQMIQILSDRWRRRGWA
jgi:polar amino acid transport system permease protein